ncbi:MAG: hypothetical protein P8Y47_00620 [Alphaproteobacteria bacterium]
MSLPPVDLDVCARTLALMDDGQPDHIRVSLAWMIRNRLILQAANTNADAPLSVPRTCRDILWEAVGYIKSSAVQMLLPPPDWGCYYAVTQLVWAGDVMDQTRGATCCHRHDRTPDWARDRAPTALIGPYLFFR